MNPEIVEILRRMTSGEISREQAYTLLVTALGPSFPHGGATLSDAAVTLMENAQTTQPTQTLGGQAVPPSGETREGAFRLAEEDLSDVFNRFLATNPTYQGLGGLGRRAMESQFGPAFRSFQLSPQAPSAEGFAPMFKDFLTGGGGMLNPQQMFSRLGEVANVARQPVEEQGLYGNVASQLGDAQNAFNAYLTPTLMGIHPLFRQAAQGRAEDVMNRFMGTMPEQSFLQYLAGRGGFFGRQ